MSIVAPERDKTTVQTLGVGENRENILTPTRRGKACNGRVAAIHQHRANNGRKPFVTDTPNKYWKPKGQREFIARGQAFAEKNPQHQGAIYVRRISRENETSEKAVAWAIPAGSKKVDHTAQAWRAALSLDELLAKRADRKRNTLAVLWVLLRYTEHDSMTVRITWNMIAKKAKVSRSTIGNVLFDLRAWGIIGIVASGRSAEYAAKAGQPEQNEAPVYVVCRPVGLGLRPQDKPDTTDNATQNTETNTACGNNLESLPGFSLTGVNSYTRDVRAREEKTQNEPLRGTEKPFGHGFAVQTHQSDHRPVELWPTKRRIISRRQGLSAAAEIARQIPIMDLFSQKNILSMVKPFFQSGWTISDIFHALDWRKSPGIHGRESWGQFPHRNPETQSHMDYCKILRAAIIYRLRQWVTPEGEIMLSESQRLAAAAAHGHAADRAAVERRAKHLAQHQTRSCQATVGAAAARAAIRAARQAKNER